MCAWFAALKTTLAAQFDCGLIFIGIGGVIRCAIFDLAGQNVTDQLG